MIEWLTTAVLVAVLVVILVVAIGVIVALSLGLYMWVADTLKRRRDA